MLPRALIMSTALVTRQIRPDRFNFLLNPSNPAFNNAISCRYYAKGKDKKKEVKGKKKIEINEDLLNEVIGVDKLKQDLDRNIEKLNEMFVKHLSVRSSAGSIEQLIVTIDGKKYPLMEVAQIMRNNPKTIVLNLAAFPQHIPSVLKAISESGMNLNPQQDGTTLFVPVPKVTKEHRETLAKNAKTHFIKCRDSIKDVQNNCFKNLKNQEKEGLAIDVSRQLQEQVKQIADDYVARAQNMLDAKQAELLGS